MFETTIRDGVLCWRRDGTRWLSTGWDGGFETAPVAYSLEVPEGWDRTDVGEYVDDRLSATGFDRRGPTLLTGVSMAHARGARLEPAVAYATVGLSNPAPLDAETAFVPDSTDSTPDHAGTVNLLVGTARSLTPAAHANLIAVAAEAKAATLLAATGFPGTTTDAVVVGCDPAGEPVEYSGSATAVGSAVRLCVRDAVRASLVARYPNGDVPGSVESAEYGVRTDRMATVFEP